MTAFWSVILIVSEVMVPTRRPKRTHKLKLIYSMLPMSCSLPFDLSPGSPTGVRSRDPWPNPPTPVTLDGAACYAVDKCSSSRVLSATFSEKTFATKKHWKTQTNVYSSISIINSWAFS